MFNIYGKIDTSIDLDELCLCSIDPGKTNFAIRIECRNKDGEIKVLLYDLIALGQNYFETLTDFFNKNIELLEKCSIFIMEQQLTKNLIVYRIAQHVISFFIIKLNNGKRIFYEIDARLKERIGYKNEKSTTKKKNDQKLIKTWSIDKAYELCKKRNDEFSINILNKSKKKDDLADVICQLQAFCEFIDVFSIFKK